MKSDARRAEILDRLADHVLANGLGSASLRPLAAAIGTSDRMLLYYFTDKAALIAALLNHIAARLGGQLAALTGEEAQDARSLARRLPALISGPELGDFTRLWLEIVALAARGDPLYREVGAAIGRGFVAWIEARLDAPADKRAQQAALLFQLVEGAALLEAIGLGDVVERAQGR